MTDKDVSTFWNWLKYLWREERSFLVMYSTLSVIYAACVGALISLAVQVVQR